MAKNFFIQDKKATKNARIATFITALIVFLGLYFITFSKVDKKAIEQRKKQEKGIVVNFGTSSKGKGNIQKQQVAQQSAKAKQQSAKVENVKQPKPAPITKPKPTPKKQTVKKSAKKTTPKPVAKKPVVTQKIQTKKVEATPKPQPEKTQQKETTQPITKPTEPKTAPKEPKQNTTNTANSTSTTSEGVKNNQPTNNSSSAIDQGGTADKPETKTVNKRSLYPGKRNVDSSGEGNTNTEGDQGTMTGGPEKGVYEGVGSGSGTSGIDHSLIGRKIIKEPTLNDNSNLEGKITIRVKVDRNGDVIGASLSSPTTISNNTLIQKAIRAAKQTKFNKNVQAAEEQFGTMTFIFKVK